VAGSAPPWPRFSPGVLLRRRKLRFRYGPVSCSPSHKDLVTPLRRSGSPPPPGASYRGPWRLPGPDLHRLANMSFAASVVTYVIAAPSTVVAPTGVSAHSHLIAQRVPGSGNSRSDLILRLRIRATRQPRSTGHAVTASRELRRVGRRAARRDARARMKEAPCSRSVAGRHPARAASRTWRASRPYRGGTRHRLPAQGPSRC
jgi:hypothetical protein